MASTKQVPPKSTAATAGRKPAGKTSRPPVAHVAGHSAVAKTALAEAKGLPGWKPALKLLGAALAAGDTAVLLECRGQAVLHRRRVRDAWQAAAPAAVEDAVAAFAALRKLAVPVSAGQDEPEYEVGARKFPARSCRVAARAIPGGEEVLVLVGAEKPRDGESRFVRRLKAGLGRLVPAFLRRKNVVDQGRRLPNVTLEPVGPDAASRQAALVDADGYVPACELVAAAVQDRVESIIFEAGPQGVSVQFEVDGIARPAPTMDAAEVKAIVGVIHAVAGIDPKARDRQSAKLTALVEGKSWPCSVSARRSSTGARIEVVIEQGRPKFKTLSDLGMPTAVGDRVQEMLKFESGVLLVTAPRRGGLSTLFDGVIGAADRLMRDFILLEDAAAPRPEIQNVKPVRWDSRTAGKPTDALEAALREYPNVLATCDLEDAELAKRLVAQAAEGRLVILGLRAADASDGIARLLALGAEPQRLGRGLLGVVGSQLVRKLCPKCRQEYFPPIETLAKLKIDLGADVTLFRADPAGCPVCTGTGYFGRTAAFEVAGGPTVQAYVAKGADADVLRKAAAKDGMAPMVHDAIAKAARGVTSVEEVQRVFRKT